MAIHWRGNLKFHEVKQAAPGCTASKSGGQDLHPGPWIQRPCALKSIITPPRLGSCARLACWPRREAGQPGLRAEQPTSACGCGCGCGWF